jgi:hypothetical protein
LPSQQNFLLPWRRQQPGTRTKRKILRKGRELLAPSQTFFFAKVVVRNPDQGMDERKMTMRGVRSTCNVMAVYFIVPKRNAASTLRSTPRDYASVA